MRMRAFITAGLSILAFAGLTTAASATTIKFVTGGTVAVGSGISGSLKAGTSAVLSSSAGNVTCTTSTFNGTLKTNGGATADGELDALTFSNCTDTIPFVTVSTVTTNVSASSKKPAISTYVGTASTFAVSGVEATITFTSGGTCIYKPTTDPATATHNSLTSPWNNEYAFTNVALTKTGGTSSVCSSTANWNASYVAVSGGVGITIQV